MIQEEKDRRQRLEIAKNLGINPYPANAHRTKNIKDVIDGFDKLLENKEKLTVGGRIMAIRKHGGISFINLKDESGSLQIVIFKEEVSEEKYKEFFKITDIGDFYEFSGSVYLTKKGEKSIKASNWLMLAKSLLPLPEKFHGLNDIEKRYRQRYLDLIANPEVMEKAKARAKMVAAMRNFLEQEGFLEVETPILQPIPGGANARPFITHHNTLHTDLYLRIAPELYLKRLLVGGFEKIYEFARCFRNEGISPQHNPEFTQIEAYWAYANIEQLIDHISKLLLTAVKAVTNGKT
ncbi:lysine--tRNA ligase, partial [Candidatus Parcubacteria bacterium]